MTTSSCKRVLIILLGSLFLTAGCASRGSINTETPRLKWADPGQVKSQEAPMKWASEGKAAERNRFYWAGPRIAVLPINNLMAGAAPLKEMEALLSDSLRKSGVSVIEKNVVKEFMARRRMRYTGGLDRETAHAMVDETGADAVLISTLELFDGTGIPRISMHGRVVSTGPDTEILWIEDVCMAGDDSPGILELGVIDDPMELMEITTERLVHSLVLHLAGADTGKEDKSGEKGIRPRDTYRSPGLGSGEALTVAVLPFQNLSERVYAWEIMPLHVVKQLIDRSDLRVLEPGIVRRGLLDSRVTVEGGLSRPHLELVLASTEADLVITGTVMEYADSDFSRSDPIVEFSLQVFDSMKKDVVWSSGSVGSGDEGIYFFGTGRRSTACELAAELARTTVVEMMAKP